MDGRRIIESKRAELKKLCRMELEPDEFSSIQSVNLSSSCGVVCLDIKSVLEDIVSEIAEEQDTKLDKQYLTHTVFGVHQNQLDRGAGCDMAGLISVWFGVAVFRSLRSPARQV